MTNYKVKCNNFEIGNDHPIFLIGGLNVIENEEITYQTAEHFKKICNKLNIENWKLKIEM